MIPELPGLSEETSLRPKMRVPTAMLTVVGLIFWIGGGVSLAANYEASGAIPVALAWSVGFAFLLFALCWSIAGRTIVARHGDQLTIRSAIATFGITKGKSISLAEAKNLTVERKVYGYKGKKIPRYAITYEQSGKRKELLGFLTRDHIELLLNGALRGIVDARHPGAN
jgi:hypothetical protein